MEYTAQHSKYKFQSRYKKVAVRGEKACVNAAI